MQAPVLGAMEYKRCKTRLFLQGTERSQLNEAGMNMARTCVGMARTCGYGWKPVWVWLEHVWVWLETGVGTARNPSGYG